MHSRADRLRQKARRESALMRTELRYDGFIYTHVRAPDEGRPIRAKAKGSEGEEYLLPFLVERRGEQYFNAKHDRPLEVRVIAWHYATGEHR